MAKKSQIFKSFADLAADMMQQTVKQVDNVKPKIKRNRIPIVKKTTTERVYVPEQSINNTIEIPDQTTQALRDFHKSLDHMEYIDGKRIPAWQESIMKKIIKQNPDSFNRTATTFNPVYPKYKSNDFGIADYFKPQQYRGIGNVDSMFEQAGSMSALGADDAANQFLSAGLTDVAAITRGMKPTPFKYKPSTGNVSKQILEEMTARRSSPMGTIE